MSKQKLEMCDRCVMASRKMGGLAFAKECRAACTGQLTVSIETPIETGEKLKQQLEHQFYKDADGFREMIKHETMVKATMKYDEPFNPASWTNEQLAKHAMAENYDQSNYIYGMYERMQEQEETINKIKHTITENCELRKEIGVLQHINEFWRSKALYENGQYLKLKALHDGNAGAKVNQLV